MRYLSRRLKIERTLRLTVAFDQPAPHAEAASTTMEDSSYPPCFLDAIDREDLTPDEMYQELGVGD